MNLLPSTCRRCIHETHIFWALIEITQSANFGGGCWCPITTIPYWHYIFIYSCLYMTFLPYIYNIPIAPLPLVLFFFPYWAGQMCPSIVLRIGCAIALMVSISGHFQSKFPFWLIWGFLSLLGGSGDGISICININSIKANPLVRYGGPGEGVKRVK